ncbi:hypothetical protein J3R30DRAFT_3440671, partial [Lentinula aciculospora]
LLALLSRFFISSHLISSLSLHVVLRFSFTSSAAIRYVIQGQVKCTKEKLSFSAIFSSSLTSSSLTLEERSGFGAKILTDSMTLRSAGRYYLILLSIRDSG